MNMKDKMKLTAILGAAMLALNVGAADAPQPFLPEGGLALGVNYWASKNSMRMWQDWEPDEIAKDLDVIKAHGFTFLRVFPRWDAFQPIWQVRCPWKTTPMETYLTADELERPETAAGYAGVDEKMMERFEAFCDMCEARGLRLIVCPLTGHMTFRLCVPQALENRDLYADPVALLWERRYLDYFVRRMRRHRAIAAWESGNETRCLGPDTSSPEAAEVWLAYIHNTIRLADPTRPVIGPDSPSLNLVKETWRVDRIAPLSDILSVHVYNMWKKAYLDAGNGIRNAFLAPSFAAALADIGGKPAFVEEHGIRRAESMSKENVARYARGLCWNLWAAGGRGLGWWCAFDQDNQLVPPYDWCEPYLELGIFKSDRTPYPAAKSVARFAAFLKTLPFAALPPAKEDCVIVVRDGEMVNATYVLARQAGLQPRFADPTKKLPEASVYFLPDARGRAHLTQRRWEELKARVREGGATLAISWNDTFLSGHEEVFGAEIESRTPGKPVFRPLTAEVLEREADGRPYLLKNRYGKGTVYLMTRPLATALNAKTGGFDSKAWQYYARVCPRAALVEDGVRDVTASEHPFADGSVGVVLVNNSPKAVEAKPKVAAGWRVAESWTDDAAAAGWKDGSLRLDGNAGILLVLRRD